MCLTYFSSFRKKLVPFNQPRQQAFRDLLNRKDVCPLLGFVLQVNPCHSIVRNSNFASITVAVAPKKERPKLFFEIISVHQRTPTLGDLIIDPGSQTARAVFY